MIWSFIEIAFVAVMILIIIGLATFVGSSAVIALCVFVVGGFIGWLIAFVLRPKKHHDHYAKEFGDYPKVPHGR